MKRKFRIAVAVAAVWASAPAHAVCDGCVVAAVEIANITITTAITSLNTAVSQMLYNIGMAINQNGNKVASTIETASQAEREFAVAQEKNRRTEDSRQRYQVPAAICSESASGGASLIAATALAYKGGARPGGGGHIANPAISQAVNAPNVPPEIDASRAARIHAQFCDADDHASYGGSPACPEVSTTMPGADKRIDSLLIGAGPGGKAPDLTFSQAQADAARMYILNSARRSVAPQLQRSEADSVAGAQYIGLMTQFNAVLSAAVDPQEQRLVESLPNPATREVMAETLRSPSAAAYYRQNASTQARTNGLMSAREFESFEVGRRYANTEYQADLQAMNGDNLLREQIRVSALNNWLMLRLKDEVQRSNILNGMILAGNARQEFGPALAQKYQAVAGRVGTR